jgi:hypothetical protein
MHITLPHFTLSAPVSGASNYAWKGKNLPQGRYSLFVGGKVNKMGILKALNNNGSITIEK